MIFYLGDTSATASVQTVARMSAPSSVYYETKTHATSNPCYLSCHNHASDDNIRVDKVEKVEEENEEVDQESSSQVKCFFYPISVVNQQKLS